MIRAVGTVRAGRAVRAVGTVRSVRVVRQPRDGFRAAAARNLGAGHARGRVLCFLDGDTVPEDGYVAALHTVREPWGCSAKSE